MGKGVDYQRSLRFPADLKREIERYAVRNNISFAEAVRQLCEIALCNSSDEVYAPRLEKMLDRSEDSIVDKLELAINHAVDDIVTEFRVSEVRKLAALTDDSPVVPGYNSGVFISERYDDEKEIIWPL